MADNYDSIHIEYYYGTMVPMKVTYSLKNEKHNLRGPAVICYYPSGNVRFHYYYINGVLHRRGKKPAMIEFYEDGYTKLIKFFKYGVPHTLGGNHIIRYDPGTQIGVIQKPTIPVPTPKSSPIQSANANPIQSANANPIQGVNNNTNADSV